jgi:hypothetical protein
MSPEPEKAHACGFSFGRRAQGGEFPALVLSFTARDRYPLRVCLPQRSRTSIFAKVPRGRARYTA